MALKIKNEKIIGTIDNLEEKLEGKLPVDRLELLYLINSWGRIDFFYTGYLNENLKIEECKSKECYDLSKLDTSKITNMDSIFKYSLFTDIHSRDGIGLHNGDISNWNISNVTDMREMFFCARNFNQDIGNWDVSSVTNMLDMFSFAENFNQPLNSWNVSNVTNMNGMFYKAEKFNQPIDRWDVSNVTDIDYMFAYTKVFNQNISSWNFDKVEKCISMFYNTHCFLDKYNSGKPLPNHTDDIKEWVNLNRDKMNEIDIKDKYGKEIDDFFSNFSNKEFSKEI